MGNNASAPQVERSGGSARRAPPRPGPKPSPEIVRWQLDQQDQRRPEGYTFFDDIQLVQDAIGMPFKSLDQAIAKCNSITHCKGVNHLQSGRSGEHLYAVHGDSANIVNIDDSNRADPTGMQVGVFMKMMVSRGVVPPKVRPSSEVYIDEQGRECRCTPRRQNEPSRTNREVDDLRRTLEIGPTRQEKYDWLRRGRGAKPGTPGRISADYRQGRLHVTSSSLRKHVRDAMQRSAARRAAGMGKTSKAPKVGTISADARMIPEQGQQQRTLFDVPQRPTFKPPAGPVFAGLPQSHAANGSKNLVQQIRDSDPSVDLNVKPAMTSIAVPGSNAVNGSAPVHAVMDVAPRRWLRDPRGEVDILAADHREVLPADQGVLLTGQHLHLRSGYDQVPPLSFLEINRVMVN